MGWRISSSSSCSCTLSFSPTYSTVKPPMTGSSAPLSWFQFCSGLEGLEAHVRQMSIRLGVWIGAGISVVVAGVREDNSLAAGPVRQWVCQRVAELGKAGLQGVKALREDRRHWGVDSGGGGGGGGRRGQGFTLRICLAVEESWLRPLTWALHTQEPRDPLQQNQVHLTDKETLTNWTQSQSTDKHLESSLNHQVIELVFYCFVLISK